MGDSCVLFTTRVVNAVRLGMKPIQSFFFVFFLVTNIKIITEEKQGKLKQL